MQRGPGSLKAFAWRLNNHVFPGSSRGRGARAAGWFADFLAAKGDKAMESLVLEGGIAGWVAAGGRFLELVDGYREEVWRRD